MSAAWWTPAYIALGSNLDSPQLQIKRALQALTTLPDTHLVLQSALYQSQPLGPQDQPPFINAVVGVLTQLTALQLLSELQRTEQQLGRVPPPVRWGPRSIDLDILLHDDSRSDTAQLQLPHPGIATRNFVVVPLAEIAPTLTIPGEGTVLLLAQRLGNNGLVRLS